MNLSDLIDRNAAFAPDKPAIRFAGTELTYRALAERISETAAALNATLGVGRGDRVAILASNHPDYLVLLYACARLGAMLVPVNWRLAGPEQLYILCNANAKVLVVEQSLAGIVSSLGEVLPQTRVVGLDFTPPQGPGFADLLLGAGRKTYFDE